MKRFLSFVGIMLAVVAYIALGWIAGLIVLSVAVVSAYTFLSRTRQALASTTTCPRGHEVPQYGLLRCGACGAVSESWVWRCPICAAEFGHTPCPTCGLAVQNPLVR
ncbi:MAG: hypothetical protein U0326_06395 [Polyangiales bacterium]